MTTADGQVAVTFNGEIYNYIELQQELSTSYRFRGHSDTEVILAAYEQWGDDCLRHFRGMFALAIWDGRRQRLLCATDRLSIKPVLYHLDGGRLLFASEVKPLAAAGVRLDVNERRLVEYLRHGQLDHSEDTLFAGIRQLRPGTYFVYEQGQVTLHRYWDLPDVAEDDGDSDRDALSDRVDDVLRDAVDLHLRGDVAPALSLSSGLDSQVLRALIQRDNRYLGLHCFTHCFSGTPYDECGPAREIASGAAVHFHGTEVTPDDFLARLDALVHVMEGPVGGLGIYGYWMNSRTAADHGFKVLLDGQGGDEAFAGYRYYYGARLGELEARGDRAALELELDAFNRAHGTDIEPGSARFRELVASADPDHVRAPDGTALGSDYLTRDLAARWADAPPDRVPTPAADRVKTAMYRDLFALKIPKLLRFQDRAAMASSVEVRVPFLDHVLLETLWQLPSRVLLSGGLTKSLLRRLAADRLGVTIDRPKLYVSAPQREWMKGPLRPACRALVQDSTLAADGWIDAAALLRQYDDYCASPALGNSFFIWKFVTLELWYRRFIARRAGAGASPSLSHA
jgi:asparagine synthase (glutamine-hydrolysing)